MAHSPGPAGTAQKPSAAACGKGGLCADTFEVDYCKPTANEYHYLQRFLENVLGVKFVLRQLCNV